MTSLEILFSRRRRMLLWLPSRSDECFSGSRQGVTEKMLRWTSLWPVPSPVPTLPPPLHAQAELSTARMIAKCGTQQKTARDCLPPNCPRDTWRHAPPGHQPAQASWSSTGKAHRVWWEGSCEPAGAKNISPPNARQRSHDYQPPPRCWLLAPRNGWDWVISDSIWNVKLLNAINIPSLS